MDVAVVIPIWNRAALVSDTLDCVWKQTRAPRTVVVVDDGSTDGTPEVVEAWRDRVRPQFEFRLVRSDHGGAGAARNRGVEAAGTHDFLHFLDSDDLLPEDFYARMATVLQEDPGAGGASCDQTYFDSDGRILRSRSLAGIERDLLRWMLRNDGGILSVSCIRASVFEEFGPFDEATTSGADAIFLASAAREMRWLYVPGAAVRYRQTGDNLSRPTPEKSVLWAKRAEEFYRHPRIPHAERGHHLARRWRNAGNTARDAGDRLLARACYANAIRKRWMFLRAHSKYLSTFLGRW